MTKTYAIIEAGGKQHKVAAEETIEVESLSLGEGKEIEFSKVMLIADGEHTIIGTPTTDGAKVIATSLGEGRQDKIIVFKYKNKTRYRRKKGHRQPYTRLKIKEIINPGGEAAKKPRKEKAVAGGES
jgi:large subunit ribosomal protein L21